MRLRRKTIEEVENDIVNLDGEVIRLQIEELEAIDHGQRTKAAERRDRRLGKLQSLRDLKNYLERRNAKQSQLRNQHNEC